MAIYNPGKYYLISVDEQTDTLIVSPFDVETIRQELMEPYNVDFDYRIPSRTSIRVEGQLYGTARILKSRDLDDISYEELMGLIKE